MKCLSGPLIAAAAGWLGINMISASAQAAAMVNPFFAMDTGTRDATHQTVESQVQLTKDIGFAGWGPMAARQNATADVEHKFAVCGQAGIKLYALYSGFLVDGGTAGLAPQVTESIQALKGHPESVLWIHIDPGKTYKRSDPAAKPLAIDILKEVAKEAEAANVRVALYPHAGAWLETVDEAVDLVKSVGSKNIGVTFNLCHFLRMGGAKQDVNAVLKNAMPYLWIVTINGASNDGSKILPLDQGEYNVEQVMADLVRLGYTGPIGLQHFGMRTDVAEKLKASMEAWKKLSVQAMADATKTP
jgi:sugar phosphate isomerase/epimerase